MSEIKTSCENGDVFFSSGEWDTLADCVDITVDEIQLRLTDAIDALNLEGECTFAICDGLITGTFGQTSDGELVFDVNLDLPEGADEIVNDILDVACENAQTILSQYDCTALSTSQAQTILDTYATFALDEVNCDFTLCGLSPAQIDGDSGNVIWDWFEDIGDVFVDGACGTFQTALDQIDCQSISSSTAASVVNSYNTVCDLTLCGVTSTSGVGNSASASMALFFGMLLIHLFRRY